MRPQLNRTQSFFAVLLPAVIWLLSACATTKLVDVWMDESLAANAFKKVLVIGVSDNEMKRRLFEQIFTKRFRARDIEALTSYSILPVDAKPEKDVVAEAIKGKGFDIVLITHYAGTDEETVYVPGNTRIESDYRRRFSRYYRNTYTIVHEPGYYSKQTSVYLQTNIYAASDGKLIWSARSKTANPASATEMFDSLSAAVMKRLEKDGFVQLPTP